MNWLFKHLGPLVHAAIDAVEQHPDKVVKVLRFVATGITTVAPAAGTVVGIVEGIAEKVI